MFLFCFVFMLSSELCRCSSDRFPVQQTTYRIGNQPHIIILGMVEVRSIDVKTSEGLDAFRLFFKQQLFVVDAVSDE